MSCHIKRTELTSEQITQIRKHLCLKPQAPKVFNPQQNFYTTQNTKESILFYKVLDDEVVLPYYFYKKLTDKQPNSDKVFPQVNFEMIGKPRPYQEPVLEEAIEHLTKYGTTLLGVYPAFGKTFAAAFLAQWSKVVTCIFYHRQILGSQWLSTFKEHTKARVWLVEEPEEPEDGYDIILCMDTQFYKLAKKITDKIGMIVFDEVHAFCTPSRVDCWLGTEPKYVVTLSATPEREDEMHSMRQAVCGLHGIYRLNEAPFTLIRFFTGIKPETKKNKQGTLDWNNLVTTLCENEIRNSYIIDFVKQNLQFKILILTWRKGHAKLIHEKLNSDGIKTAIMAGTTTSYSDSKVLVGTISKIGTGFDEKSACQDFGGERINLLIMVGSTKSESIIEQTLGRVFRSTDPYIVFFNDDVGTIRNHYSILKKWATQSGRNANIFDMKSAVIQTREKEKRSAKSKQEELLEIAAANVDS